MGATLAKDYIPDMRWASGGGAAKFRPSFELSGDSMNRVMPQQLTPSFGSKTKSSDSFVPVFKGMSFSPRQVLSGTGMESLLGDTSFSPSFGKPLGGGFGLPTDGGFNTLDDVLRQHGIGQYAPMTPGTTGNGVIADLGDHPLNAYNALFLSAGNAEGIDPLLLKAIAYIEHGWDQPVSPAGAVGIMQLMPNWESELGINRQDPAQNILGGAKVLKMKFGEGNGTWEDAVARYHGYGSDGYTTDQEYVNLVFGVYAQLKAAAPSQGSGSGVPNYSGGGSGLASVFGGQSFGISQGIGPGNNAMDYSYGIGLGVGNNHPGIDISAPYGGKVYFPKMAGGITGTVISAGGTGYFQNDGGDYQGAGELRIQLTNGDIIIFGHMSNIAVRPGQQINLIGTYLGETGTAGSGAHLHLEYRKVGNCPDGYCAIDPRNVIGY